MRFLGVWSTLVNFFLNEKIDILPVLSHILRLVPSLRALNKTLN